MDAAEVSVILLQSLHNLLVLTVQLPNIVSYRYQQLVVVLPGDVVIGRPLLVSAGQSRIDDQFCLCCCLNTRVGLSLPCK